MKCQCIICLFRSDLTEQYFVKKNVHFLHLLVKMKTLNEYLLLPGWL